MIPNEVLAAWIVTALTGVAALGGLSLLDGRLSAGAAVVEAPPLHYAGIGTGQRLPPLNGGWKSRFEATGSLPIRPLATLVEWSDDPVDEMELKDGRDELLAGAVAAVDLVVKQMAP